MFRRFWVLLATAALLGLLPAFWPFALAITLYVLVRNAEEDRYGAVVELNPSDVPLSPVINPDA